jgi:hypothetical protein
MKGYYTIKLMGSDLPGAERIALETRYVQALESALGGHERVVHLCLAAAAAARNTESQVAVPVQVPHELKAACDSAEADAWGACSKPKDARFSLSAWSAADLS